MRRPSGTLQQSRPKHQSWYAAYYDNQTGGRHGCERGLEEEVPKRLRSEPGASPKALFVFYPPGVKAKYATGITASEPNTKRELGIMAAIQRKAAGEFIVTDEKAT